MYSRLFDCQPIVTAHCLSAYAAKCTAGQCENSSTCRQSLYSYECLNCKLPNYGKNCDSKHNQIAFNQTNSNLNINMTNGVDRAPIEIKFKFLIRRFALNLNQISFLSMRSNDNSSRHLTLNLIKISQNEFLIDLVYQSSATDSIYLKNLFKKQLNYYDLNKFYLQVDYRDDNLKIYLNETNFYQINDLKLPSQFTFIQVHNTFDGFLTEFYLNGRYAERLVPNTENNLIDMENGRKFAVMEQATCLFDRFVL
jgi:hypothetical protein